MVVGCLAVVPMMRAQSAPQTPNTQQTKPPANPQQTPAQTPGSSPGANPFPEDTSSVPVVPTTGSPIVPQPEAGAADNVTTTLLGEDTDPAKSPDDPAPDSSSGADSGFSSSLAGSGDVNIREEEKPGKHGKLSVPEPVHQETAQEDENVGQFELSRKNWKAALSRYESALVTDPDNPEVYWGMAEAQRALGDFAKAKANYLKVVDYDPDSKHGKEAKKLLKEPELANAPAVSVNKPAGVTPQ